MIRNFLNKKNNKGVTLAEMLIVVAILLILMSIAIPSVFTVQRNLRQKELDSKAETIYVAVQNKLSKMKAGGNTAAYQLVPNSANGVVQLTNIPGDADPDVDNIAAGDICYFTSASLNAADSAASVIMDGNTLDDSLLNNHWVIEFNPLSSVVYAVYYSENRTDCAKGYVDDFSKYDLSLRFRENRKNDGARVGYYGGGSVGYTNTVSTLNPVLKITNNEKLTADISCILPVFIADYPVFKIDLEDTSGTKYTKYYAYWACSNEYMTQIRKEAGSNEIDNSPNSMQRVGRTFTLNLVLDDLSTEGTRFAKMYGEDSDHTQKLQSGTPLKVTVTAMCPGNYTATQTLSDSEITNSLFSDSNCQGADSTDKDLKLNKNYGDINHPAEVHYARHLQNLDESSKVAACVQYVRQSSDITFAENPGQEGNDDWYETYKDKFFNGVIGDIANFKPINNSNLISYDGKKDETAYRIMNLTMQTTAKQPSDVGLFTQLHDGQSLHNIILTGTNIKNQEENTAAGTLVGNIKGTDVVIDHCQAYLNSADIKGKTNRDVWISGKTAGGLVGMISSKGNVTINDSAASTVIGDHLFDDASSAVDKFFSDSVGGLIGAVSQGANVDISKSYADCYLVGNKTGGLVGNSNGSISIKSCYSAGFMSYGAEGAGFVCGSSELQNSYTVIQRHEMRENNLPYFAVAKSGSAQGKVYYSAISVNTSNNEIANTESMGALTIRDMTDAGKNTYLGDAFVANTASSVPYNLMGQTLSTYTYPVLQNVNHYGDWQADFQVGAVVYYEKYNDGTYGFYGANVESTLKNDPDLIVLGDGYGVVYLAGESNLPSNVTVTIKDQDTVLLEKEIAIAGQQSYSVNGNGKNYSIYPFDKELVNTHQPSARYYLKAEISSPEHVDHYYFNPHFAKTVVYLTDASNAQIPTLTDESHIAIRTARHLYMLSEYYETYANVTAPCTYLQERNIAYTDYEWENFTLKVNGLSEQSPIAGGKDIPFKAVYDGQCNWITNISFTTTNGLYVGFFGHNAGILRNIVLKAEYKEGSDHNYYVGRSGDIQRDQTVYMGVLTGRNDYTGMISNCAVAGYYIAGSDGTIHAYQNSNLYGGGLVGENAGKISACTADTPTLRLSSSYANVYLGGFVGNNKGIIDNCYALGHIEVAFAKGGSVSIAGFAGKNTTVIRDSYCATALTASGETTTAYGFAPESSLSACRYLNNGTFSYLNHLYSFNFDEGGGTASTFHQLKVDLNGPQAAVYSYSFNNTQTASRKYPFRAVIKDAKGNLVHYGDWLDDEDMGVVGVFYWENEVGGSNNGYHFTYLGTVGDENVGGTTLCNAHDDGGVISEYGYGYFELNQGSVISLQLDGAVINGKTSFVSTDDAYNEEASKALKEQMHLTLEDGSTAQYYFYAFTTRTKEEADAAKGSTDNGNYVCLDGNERKANSTWKLYYEPATGGTSNIIKYEFTVSPFFANAMGMTGGKTITSSDGISSNYANIPGTDGNHYEVRCIQQLQYINWNFQNKNTATLVDSGSYKKFNYLMFAKTDTQNIVTKKSDITDCEAYFWRQSHDVDGTKFSGYTPIAGNNISSSAQSYNAVLYAWFGGHYNGESYKIQNVNITSNSFSVGLFGITAGANMKNIILYSDNDSVIRRKETPNYPDKAGAYCIGGLIGVAYDYNVNQTDNYIENCAIAGYKIEDRSTNQQGLGEANVGGLIGAANVHLKNCSAVTDILVDSRHQKGTALWGIYTRVGGLTGAAQGIVTNCFSGGNVKISDETLNETPAYTENFKDKNEIYIGGIAGSAFTSNYMNFTGKTTVLDGSPTLENCYSYVSYPLKKGPIVAMFRIASLSDRVGGDAAAGEKKVTINNCFYLTDGISKDVLEIYNGDNSDRTSGKPEPLSYDQMSDMSAKDGLLSRLHGKLNTGSNPLKYGAGYSNVTTQEGNANVAIDGKYSYPGGNAALIGKNYPFPAIIQQKDLTYSTAANPRYVYVQYGEWPIDGPYWDSGRDSMDIFRDMEDDGYAVKKFYLDLNGENNLGEITTDRFVTDPSIAIVKEVKALENEEGRYEVSILAVNKGTTSVLLAGTTAEFNLEVTANIKITADPEILQVKEGESGEVQFTASSIVDEEDENQDPAKSYELSDQTSWSIEMDRDLVTLAQNEEQKNLWTVTSEGMGKTTLTVTFTYEYPNPNQDPNSETQTEPTIFTEVAYVTVKQPDTIGLSDGNQYNVAYLGDEDKTGKDTAYSVDRPMVSDTDFFLYLNTETPDIVKLQEMPLIDIFVGEKDNEAVKTTGISDEKVYYSTEDGYCLEIDKEITEDELYQYLSGKIYYTSKDASLEKVENVPLYISVAANGSDVYELSIKLQEVNVRNELTVTYADRVATEGEEGTGQVHTFTRTLFPGEQTLPTEAEVLEECKEFVIPEMKMLEGWTTGDQETVYPAGSTYNFTTDVNFYAVFKNIEVILDGNGGSFNGEETFTVTLENDDSMKDGTIYLTDYSYAGNPNYVSRAGYELSSWNTSSDGSGRTYHYDSNKGQVEPVQVVNLKPNYRLYAQWDPKTYFVELRMKDDDTYDQKVKVTYGKDSVDDESENAKYETPTRDGYVLAGWENDKSETVIRIDVQPDTAKEMLVLVPGVEGYTDENGNWIKDEDYSDLYAQWRQTRLILENGEKEYQFEDTKGVQKLDEEKYIPFKETLRYVDEENTWELEGWYTEKSKNSTKILDENGNVVAAVDGYSKVENNTFVLDLKYDTTLYACWKKVENIRYVKTDSLVEGHGYVLASTDSGEGRAFGKKTVNDQISAKVNIQPNNGLILTDATETDMSYFVFKYDSGTLEIQIDGTIYYLKANDNYNGHTATDDKTKATRWVYEDGNLKGTNPGNESEKRGYFFYENNGGGWFVVRENINGRIYLFEEKVEYTYSFIGQEDPQVIQPTDNMEPSAENEVFADNPPAVEQSSENLLEPERTETYVMLPKDEELWEEISPGES